MGRYRNRADAGRVLAEALQSVEALARPVVLALPRGGVPVAVEVAAALSAPLAVVVVRKIGAPGRPELAIGALAQVGSQISTYRNYRTSAAVGVGDHAFAEAAARARTELERRGQAFATADAPPLEGADVVVVAVPVAPPSAIEALRRVADAVVCPRVPAHFVAVGLAYADFAQLTDHDVNALLN